MEAEVEALKRRVRELETARDHQAELIRQLRERGSVTLPVGGGMMVYGTSLAIGRVREQLT